MVKCSRNLSRQRRKGLGKIARKWSNAQAALKPGVAGKTVIKSIFVV